MLRFIKRMRGNFAWSLAAAIAVVEHYQFQRILLILGLATAGAVFYSLFDVAQERWPQPVRWYWKRLAPGKRPN